MSTLYFKIDNELPVSVIDVCISLTAVITESSSPPFIFHIRITLPSGSSGETLDAGLIEDLIQKHKPAYAGYVLK